MLDQLQWSRVGRMAAAEPLDRLLHADLLAAAGRYADALRWYGTIGSGAPQELPLVGFAAMGMARASERLGDPAGALREYRRVAELWRDADPALQALAVAAGRRVAALDSVPPR
jgi:tetratricopeptide (TPR) repeat protein